MVRKTEPPDSSPDGRLRFAVPGLIDFHIASRVFGEIAVRRRAALELELKLLTAELRSDAALRAARGCSTVEVSARDAYLRKIYGRGRGRVG